MKKDIYLVRHGEANSVEKGTRQLPVDGLSLKGRDQVGRLAEAFPRVEVVISSPWQRTIETALAIKGDAQLILDEKIHERIEPDEVIGIRSDSVASREFMERVLSSENRSNPWWKEGNGESMFEVSQRAQDFKERLLDRPEQKIGVVSHSYFLRSFLANELTGQRGNLMWSNVAWSFFLSNTGVSHIEFSDDRFKVHYINDISHLRD